MHTLILGRHTLQWGLRTTVMGILNITPDSFSGDGLLSSASSTQEEVVRKAIETAGEFLAAGADILDIGGESTRPGSQPVNAGQELARVLPIIQALAAKFPEALISIDTSKSAVAAEALEAGASMVNDVWGLRLDPGIAEATARHGAALGLMHNRSKPASVETREKLGSAYAPGEYTDLMEDVKRDLMESVAIARSAGMPDDRIILDPGLGFGKSVEQNLELINRLGEIRALGFPVLLGPSRKSFIGYTLNLPPDQRLEGTAAAVAVGIVRGADIIRVHDVQVMARISRMTDAIVRNPKT
jgi:dihydropteroate synthase